MVRRIRENMEAIFAGVAATFVPIGFMCVVIAKDLKSIFVQNALVIGGGCMAFLGVVVFLGALWLAWQRDKQTEKRESWQTEGSVLFMNLLEQVLSELKGLREDAKGGKNGHSNTNK
jgi:uncharacterized membrane protein